MKERTNIAIDLKSIYAPVECEERDVDQLEVNPYNMPWDVLGTVTSRIVNEVKHVNRVFYDCTGKPPATIELE